MLAAVARATPNKETNNKTTNNKKTNDTMEIDTDNLIKSPEEMYELALQYRDGRGVEQDREQAREWCRASAELGYVPAMVEMGRFCMGGFIGVPAWGPGVKWFQEASGSSKGNGEVELLIAMSFETGVGVKQATFMAKKWYRTSMECGNFWATKRYNEICEQEQEAAERYRAAAEAGDAKAQLELADCYCDGSGVPADMGECVRWARRAAEQGFAKAQVYFARLYLRGDGVPQDDAEAFKWFLAAAEQGDDDAEFCVAGSYYDGTGVPKNLSAAKYWYRRSAEHGNRFAAGMLETLQEKEAGDGDEV